VVTFAVAVRQSARTGPPGPAPVRMPSKQSPAAALRCRSRRWGSGVRARPDGGDLVDGVPAGAVGLRDLDVGGRAVGELDAVPGNDPARVYCGLAGGRGAAAGPRGAPRDEHPDPDHDPDDAQHAAKPASSSQDQPRKDARTTPERREYPPAKSSVQPPPSPGAPRHPVYRGPPTIKGRKIDLWTESAVVDGQRHEGSHSSACQWEFVIESPFRIGHSQTKLATTTPTYRATTNRPVPRRS
jgi:hypothetical protein